MKYWTEVPLEADATYVDFDLDTGIVKTIGSQKTSEHSIQVEYNSVKDLVDGKVYFKHYRVQFNPTTTMYELVNKHDELSFQYNVNHSLYCVPKTSKADIMLVKDYKSQKWKIRYGNVFSKTLEENSVTLQTIKHFSIAKKNDPYILYRTLSFNLASLDLCIDFNHTDAITLEYDVYTSKLFNSYGVVVND